MDFIVTGRQAGKTFRLLQWMERTPNSVMICPTVQQAHETFRRAKDLGFDLERDQFIAFSQRSKIVDREDPRICVDNVDLMLALVFQKMPDVGTATGRALSWRDEER